MKTEAMIRAVQQTVWDVVQADPFSGAIALSLLTLLAISGAWTAVYHYAVKAKHARRKSSVGA